METFFVGDLHGCRAELEELLASIAFRQDLDRLLLTGDVFSRGPDPRGVWRLLQHSGARMVLGNHDARLLEHLQARRAGRPIAFSRAEHQSTLAALQAAADRLLPWLEACPLYLEEDGFVLTHAGINPEKGLARTTRDEFLAIRRWPAENGLEGPRWHDFYQPPDDRLLLFGHDAPGGLVVKSRPDGRPYLLGLDTGCVYGGQLTAYALQADRLVQVACRRSGGYY